MAKFYFEISGISMELNNEDEADKMCKQITEILINMGVKDADVLFSDEEYFNKEHSKDY